MSPAVALSTAMVQKLTFYLSEQAKIRPGPFHQSWCLGYHTLPDGPSGGISQLGEQKA